METKQLYAASLGVIPGGGCASFAAFSSRRISAGDEHKVEAHFSGWGRNICSDCTGATFRCTRECDFLLNLQLLLQSPPSSTIFFSGIKSAAPPQRVKRGNLRGRETFSGIVGYPFHYISWVRFHFLKNSERRIFMEQLRLLFGLPRLKKNIHEQRILSGINFHLILSLGAPESYSVSQ